MAEQPIDSDDLSSQDSSAPSHGHGHAESPLDEVKDAQINRMAGCAKLGGCLIKVILVLAALGFLYRCAKSGGWNWGPQEKIETVKTQATLKDLRLGFQYFDIEYKTFPVPQPPSAGDASIRSEGVVIQALMHKEGPFNPRDIKFLNAPIAQEGKGGMVGTGTASQLKDVWGEMYHIVLDTNQDGQVIDPEEPTKSLAGKVVIYSSGPDRDPKTWADNVRSWK